MDVKRTNSRQHRKDMLRYDQGKLIDQRKNIFSKFVLTQGICTKDYGKTKKMLLSSSDICIVCFHNVYTA
ncbi:uncharacterized protein LOC143080861 isoform X2 [Mytilus galloprovincialis]|uniref:uncharacterized protein LOC143080861 isoform X2 n=1 Tax=Mytilus galloprovincialis TaxID=29158 RepID=UPI003F7C3F8A